MNGGKKPANTGSGSPVLQGGEDVTNGGLRADVMAPKFVFTSGRMSPTGASEPT